MSSSLISVISLSMFTGSCSVEACSQSRSQRSFFSPCMEGPSTISFRVDLRPVKMHPALAIAKCVLPRKADAKPRSFSVKSRPAVPCVIPGPARRKRSLVFFLIHLRCAEDDLDKMATPSSDDVRGSADRISPRHAFETRIWIRLQRDGEKLILQGWSRDLSESGVGAFVAEALILSESVTLEIPLPDCDKQVIPAKVVRALGTEYGFQFTALSAEQRRQIRAALKERPAIPRHGAGR